MANTLTIKDAYTLINGIAAQALGSSAIQAVDTSSYVAVGEKILQTALESTLNAIAYTFGRTIFSVRPYTARLSSMERDEERFGMITRKITYLTGEAEASQDYNTDVNSSQLADGQSIDHYKIKAPKAVQLNFPGAQTLQDHITRFRDQIALALRDPAEMIRFWEGAMTQFYNDIERQREAKTRAVVLNRIAGQVSMGIGVVDLVYEYNAANGTAYSRAQLLTTYEESFWKFAMARVKKDSENMMDYSSLYHANLTGYAPIGRHTPKDRQRMIMYSPAFIDAETNVYSTIFRPDYLEIGAFEGVTYWQSKQSPTAVNCKPNVLNTTSGESESALAAVEIPYVLGILYDEEAMGVMPKFDYAIATPVNAAGNYYNLFVHWLFKMYNDFTENSIVYVLGDLTSEGSRALNIQLYGSNLSPSFAPTTYSYTATLNVASRIVYVVPADGGSALIRLGDVEYANGSTITFEAGVNTLTVVCSKPGYADTTYTITVTFTPPTKDGGDDSEPEPEEPKSTKSTKSTK